VVGLLRTGLGRREQLLLVGTRDGAQTGYLLRFTRLCTCWTKLGLPPAGPSLSDALDAVCNVTGAITAESRRRRYTRCRTITLLR